METLESVSIQSYSNWECIIVDDGSTDNTEQIINDLIAKDNRFQFYKRPDNLLKGANSCRNYGFEKAKGEFIQWFDSDDIMLEDFLMCKIKEFKPEINFVISSGYFWNPKNNKRNEIKIFQSNKLFIDFVIWNLKILTPSVMFRRCFLTRNDKFNITINKGQEAEFFSRLFFDCNLHEYIIIEDYNFLYRQHEETLTAKNSTYIKNYKESSLFFLLENFKRGESIKSEEILTLFYVKLVKLFFNSIQNNHDKVTILLLDNFFPRLVKYNKFKAIEIIILSKILFYLRKSPYIIRNRWINFKFNWNE